MPIEAKTPTTEYILPEPLQGNDTIQELYTAYQGTLTDELSRLELLTQEQESVVLSKYIELRDLEETEKIRESKQILIEIMTGYNIGLMYKIIIDQLVHLDRPHDDKDLYMTDAYIGIRHAMKKFVYDKGSNKFSTYATYWIRRYVSKAIKRSIFPIAISDLQHQHIEQLRLLQEIFIQKYNKTMPLEYFIQQYQENMRKRGESIPDEEKIRSALRVISVINTDSPINEEDVDSLDRYTILKVEDDHDEEDLHLLEDSNQRKYLIPSSVLSSFIERILKNGNLTEVQKRRFSYSQKYKRIPKEITEKEEANRNAVNLSIKAAKKKISQAIKEELEEENGYFRNFRL